MVRTVPADGEVKLPASETLPPAEPEDTSPKEEQGQAEVTPQEVVETQEAPPPTNDNEPKGSHFTFTMERANLQKSLGIDVRHVNDSLLEVAKILPDGEVALVNSGMANQENRLQEHDVIVRVNGTEGDDALMIAACKAKRVVFEVIRGIAAEDIATEKDRLAQSPPQTS